MQGAQWGKLVKVQHCPATVTHYVKSDNPPFMTQITSWKGTLGASFQISIDKTGLTNDRPCMGGF